MAQDPKINGGEGGGPDHLLRSEMKVLERAASKPRFHLSDEGRIQVPAEMEKLATGKRQSPRTKIAAARVLASFDALNLEQEKRDSGQSSTSPVTVNVTTVVAVKPSTNGHSHLIPGPDPANGNG